MVGDNARIGSNSVVVKDVPADATVVGIPARIVVSRDDTGTEKRRAMAKKIGFDAYGQHHGQLPDPVSQALDRILDHLHAVDDRLNLLDRPHARETVKSVPTDAKSSASDLSTTPKDP
jgi:serine O-acetyltransferase